MKRALAVALIALAGACTAEMEPPGDDVDLSPGSPDAGPDALRVDGGIPGTGDGQPLPTTPMDPQRVVAFDGVDDYISFGYGPRLLFEAGSTISVAAWIKPAAIDGYDPIVGRPVPCANAGNFLVDLLGEKLRFCYGNANTTDGHCAYISKDTIPLGVWTHFAIVYTFGQGASLKGYINGALVNDGQWYHGTGNGAPPVDPSHAVHGGHFAGCTSGSNYFYQGEMYQLVVYERGLSAQEIDLLFRRQAKLPCATAEHAQHPVELTLVDGDATGYATFQSHNQKVVANQHGIFMTHIRTRNDAYTQQTWRLSRSTDHGASFATIHEETVGTNPPALETDVWGNLYLMRQNYGVSTDSTLYVYGHSSGFTTPSAHTIPDGDSGKYAMLYDPIRGRFYYFSHRGKFYTIGSDGTVAVSYQLITQGPNAGPQYPYLAMDERGVIYAAWTSVKHGEYMYWSIHLIRSVDGGVSWQKLDATPLTPPVVCDDTGPADRVNLSDEFNVHTWLWSILPKNGKVHLAYLGQTSPFRQHYVRYDARTGALDLRVQPEWRGDVISLESLDGFAVSDPGSPNRLFWVSKVKGSPAEVGVLQSIDNGATWYDHAKSAAGLGSIYAIGGYREVTPDGQIIGSFTDLTDPNQPKVRFFKVPTRTVQDPTLCL